ncbi:MAG: 4Fe-4S dicluster domain-containing protein [Sulfolobales archaeon]|nr:4Fe-4S dicluster domain-containing protein [Sulfolobales archaeon]MCX8186098.1 4Fe-4S dicluster domain-containing protein [Sulfolobales archaeon]MDW7969393.1 4Fe-4S dicluster domain-containing protein [Sulfolobales archaeon]
MSRLSWIKTALEVGVVTKKYPFERVEVPDGFRGLPIFDSGKCIGCTACANVCTPDAIKVVNDFTNGFRRIEYRLGKCIFCGRCADVCPVSAITITKEFELAYTGDVINAIEIKFIKCVQCGQYYTVSRHLKHVSSKLNDEALEGVDICPDCRRRSNINSLIHASGVFR